jgi:hypothetical protein
VIACLQLVGNSCTHRSAARRSAREASTYDHELGKIVARCGARVHISGNHHQIGKDEHHRHNAGKHYECSVHHAALSPAGAPFRHLCVDARPALLLPVRRAAHGMGAQSGERGTALRDALCAALLFQSRLVGLRIQITAASCTEVSFRRREVAHQVPLGYTLHVGTWANERTFLRRRRSGVRPSKLRLPSPRRAMVGAQLYAVQAWCMEWTD